MTDEPWNPFSRFLRERFGGRVQRIGLDAGFTCPNRDGNRGTGGCLFCDAGGSRAEYQDPRLSVSDQMRQGMAWAARRFGADRFIAYFQAFTNTHAPLDRLRAIYDQALVDDRVVALAIGTRPDCVDAGVVDLLRRYAVGRLLWVELGFLSESQAVLDECNRGESVEEFERAAVLLRAAGLPVVAHVLFGLPGEPLESTVQAVHRMNRLGIEGVKLHNLYIVRDAPIAAAWERGEIAVPGRDAYVGAVCDFLERLDPACLIHRLSADAPRDRLLAPDWMSDKNAVLQAIRDEFIRRGTRQGARYAPPSQSTSQSILPIHRARRQRT